MRVLAAILLLCSFAAAELPDTPQPQAPHLATVRPAVETTPADEPKPRHVWVRRGIEAGSAGLAAKLADDSCDFIIGPRKSMIVGASAATITYLIVRHKLHRRVK